MENPVETIEAGQIQGASSMRELDRFDENGQKKKFYVVGRARYRPFLAESNPNANFINIMPLGASDAYDSLVASLGDPFVNLIQDLMNEPNLDQETAFKPFIENIWTVGINSVLESQNGLIADGLHTPQITDGGQFCFDIKLSKLMDKRKNDQNIDFNNNLTRTEAVQQIRLIRSKFRQLPREFMRILFRGPLGPNGEYLGLEDPEGIFADNDVDAPYKLDPSKPDDLAQFQYLDEYAGSQILEIQMKAADTQETYAYGLFFVRPGFAEQFLQSSFFRLLQQYQQDADRSGTIYITTDGGGRNDENIAGGHDEQAPGPISGLTLQGGLIGGTPKGVDRYTRLKGQCKTNRFGTYEEIESLTWIEGPSGAAIGLLQQSDGTYESPLMIRAYEYGPDMDAILQKVPQKAILVWVPPKEAGRKDGYFGDTQEPDWDLIAPWASQFDVAPMWDLGDLMDAPEDPMQRRTWKLLKACDEGYSEDPRDYGFRGGFIMELFVD